MTKKRIHQSTARSSSRPLSIDKLARSIGHESTTGQWRAEVINNHRKPSKFIGRSVVGSELIVDRIQKRFPGINFVTSSGQLTLTLMHRRALANHPEEARILKIIEGNLSQKYQDTMECIVRPYSVKQQSASREWTARVPLCAIDGDIQDELESTRDMLSKSGVSPQLQPASIRIAESSSRDEIERVAYEAFSMLGDSVLLTQPAILTADER